MSRRCSYPIRSRRPSRWFRLTAKSYGTYTGLGGGLTYFNADRPVAYSNRVNISIQRQLPQNIVLVRDLFPQPSSHITTVNYNINQVDPRIALQYGARRLKFRWPTRSIIFRSPISPRERSGTNLLFRSHRHSQSRIHNTRLTMLDGIKGGDMIYHSLQIKGDKSFSNGYTLLFGYNYHVQQRIYKQLTTA